MDRLAFLARQTNQHKIDQDEVPAVFRMETLNGCDVYEITIKNLQDFYRMRNFTCVEYVQYCLNRLQKIDHYLESVIEINPDALSIATSIDEEMKQGRSRGPLHGVPILVKDNMATKDNMQTTAGSWALLGSIVPRDAFVISQLRTAGAVILGHSNMTEWASLRSKKYSSAYSARGGEVRNAYDLSKPPYGSSAGSAVAMTANIVPLAFGTETDSSIIGPAYRAGIVGIKPTVGLTSRSGVIPISENMDSVGPFGRTVYDAVLGLNAIVLSDEHDPATQVPERVRELDYTKFISDKSALNGARFGLPWKRCWDSVPRDQLAAAQRVLDAIEVIGGALVRTDFPSAEERIPEHGKWDWEQGEPDQSEFTVVKVDAYNGIKAYLSDLEGTDIKSVEDIIAYNKANTGTEGANPGDHPAFPSGQDNLIEIAQTQGIKDETYYKALTYTQLKSRKEGFDGALKHPDGDLDALLLCDVNGVGQQMAAQAAYPIISVPIGLDSDGMPVSLSIHHSAWKEKALIKWASAIEDLVGEIVGPRATPRYRNYTSKNLPVFD